MNQYRGIGKNSRSWKYQLLIDRAAVIEELTSRKINSSMA